MSGIRYPHRRLLSLTLGRERERTVKGSVKRGKHQRMSRLSLALLGAPEVRHGGALLSFPTRKTAALLIYLAVEGGRQTRDALTTLLWPESDEARGRGALRSTLGFLRAALRDAEDESEPAHLLVERDRLGAAGNTI